MYYKRKGCKKETICDIDCWIPPKGMGVNAVTGEFVKVETLSCSPNKKDQVWFRTELPKDWEKRRAMEVDRQIEDKDYIDQDLEEFRVQEWHRRLNGVWVMINGKPVYLTGQHYFYLNWWNIGGYPDYREADRKFFYFSLYCMLDPFCLGLIEVTKRKAGKSARSGVWMYERASRTKYKWNGIQSKTWDDAKKNVFQKYIVNPFRKLPDFFKPLYDTGRAGDFPTQELRFYRPSRKGKAAGQDDREELETTIDCRSSETTSYDSQVLYSYICDEAGKFVDIDVYDLHLVVRYTCEVDGEFTGKMLYTTTVEEMESGGKGFKRLVDASDQTKERKNGRTPSGLYTFFTPAYETLYYDKYGMPDVKKAKEYYLNERAAHVNDPLAQNAIIRKNPFTLADAFRVSQEDTMFNIMKLNDRMDVIGYMDNPVTRGNFMWLNAERDTEVIFKPSKSGRWEVSWLFDDPKDANNVEKINGAFYPGNKTSIITGCDPFDQDITKDGRRSNGSALTLNKFNAAMPLKFPNKSFVCFYKYRPRTAALFYEDMILQNFYYGSPMLYERNKMGLRRYFDHRGYSNFLIWLPGEPEPGIYAHKNVHQQIAELTEDYIENDIDKVNFLGLIEDWITFDITNTQKSDPTMAAGYALIGDQLILRKSPTKVYELNEIFRRRKIPSGNYN